MSSNIIRSASCALAFVLSSLCAIPAASAGTDDAFGTFYVQQRKAYYEGQYAPEQRREILEYLLSEMQRSETPRRHGPLLWIAQEFSTIGKPSLAIPILRDLVSDTSRPLCARSAARLELGLAQYRSGDANGALSTWDAIAKDDKNVTKPIRGMAADQMRVHFMTNGDWASVFEVAQYELDNHLAENVAALSETVARSARRTGDFVTAERYYKKLLEEFPDYRAKNRMLYVEKALITVRFEGDRYQVGYLEGMEAKAREYEKIAKSEGTVFAEVYAEYIGLATSYMTLENYCRINGVDMSLSAEEVSSRALRLFRDGLDGLRNLPLELRANIEYMSSMYNAVDGIASICAAQGSQEEAVRVLESFLATLDDADPSLKKSIQRRVQSLPLQASVVR